MFKLKQLWVRPELKPELEGAGLLDIESVSQRDFDWFEAPNVRRGGWSGVARIVLNPNAPAAEQKAVFLKIQQNHYYLAPNTFFLKRLTFEREFACLQAIREHCDSIPETVLFAKWKLDGNDGAILVTEALDNWIPLRPWLLGKLDRPAPDTDTLHRALSAIAQTAREINQAGWIHMCFSAKHIFLKEREKGQFSVKVVDLEKTRRRIGLGRRAVKDCSHFMRHTPNLSQENKLHFLQAYFQADTFSSSQKNLIRRMRGAPQI
ncbi:MAG: hypothetical protein EA353_05290 [Puniceicoccaceae bacterium]|nr:MAG: hypothetical protein EA353_05290 [Puniceicoccaceae bacterium]